MELDSFTKIMLSTSFLTLGVTLGILRSRIFSSKETEGLDIYFLGISITVVLLSIFGLVFFWSNLFSENNSAKIYEFSVLLFALIAGIILFFITKKYLRIKDVYHTFELDPIVKKFTSLADKNIIKLFGGDLNFLGNIPSEMDCNNQYTDLRSSGFNRVLIICEAPVDQIQKIRYGKITTDIPGVELRYYNPPNHADLRVRGRIIKVNGSDRLLMYSKIKSKTYRAIETDTSDSQGALYNNIWELIWNMAVQPTQEEIESYTVK